MRSFAVALLLGVLLLPGLAAAQYYAHVDITCDTPTVMQGEYACFTISFDHNLVGQHPVVLEVYVEGPGGGYWLQGVYDITLRWCGDQSREDCVLIPDCAPLGEYTFNVFLYSQNGYLADQDSCTIEVVG
ncbi:hypothetical protein KQI52_04465 [bacterium]|nr:hypothetical protein [bacterium]